VRVLVVNAGSSSLKLSVVDGRRLDATRELPAPRDEVDADQVAEAVLALGAADAAGHRIVHGGARYLAPVRVDDGVLAGLRELCDLAPLHQPKSLAALEAVTHARPELPAVACFDTAFHATLPPAAATYALPQAWRERWGLRRFGFHGLSHAYASARAAELLGRDPDGLRLVTCHLGAGASLAAVRSGRSLDTTMGFTPLEGLAMATRSGSVDPGLLLWLLERTELGEPRMAYALEHESGMLALAGSPDMRSVLTNVDAGDPDARLALDVYVHRLTTGIAAMAAAAGGIDAVVFTGGVGEHAPAIRAAAAAGLEWLGVRVDPGANAAAAGDCEITGAGATVRSLVVTAREDLEIARQVVTVLT
jgi:acetate kinase